MRERLEPIELGERDGAAVRRELVVAAPFVVVARDAIGRLDDEPVVDQTIESAVERSRAHSYRAVAQLRDPAHQAVPVELPIEEGQHDVQRRRRERLLRSSHTRILIYRLSTVKAGSVAPKTRQ